MADHPQRITRLIPLADALARIEALVQPVAPHEVEARDAVGRVLAADIAAANDIPPRAVALRDGFAVRADDLADAGSYAAVPLAGIPYRIDLGRPLPPDADTVAPADIIAERNGRAEATAPVTPGEGVLPAGGDIRAGDMLLRSGSFLRPGDAAVLAAAGIGRVSVRIPRLRIENDRDGLIGMLVAKDGAVIAALDADTDAIIRISGTGAGRNDTAVQRLAREGRVEFHGVGIAPGDSAAFGLDGGKPALLLPGRLDARLAAWLMLGRPLLARLSGRTGLEPATVVRLRRKATSSLGLAEIVPVRVGNGEAEPIASGYWPLAAIAQSDGWIVIPAESEGYPAGTEVVVKPWP